MATDRYWSYRTSAAILAHLTVAAIITLLLVWLLHFRGGVAFKSDDRAKIFNLHPLLMVVGFIISGEAMMVYKTVPASKKGQKLIHLILQLIALISGTIGVYEVFNFHSLSHIIHMYTLHSWLGMATICLFAIQWVLSLLILWYPGAQPSMKARVRVVAWHGGVGMLIFLMAILSGETGLVEKFFFLGLKRNQEALILNFTGILIFLFAVFVAFTLLLPTPTHHTT